MSRNYWECVNLGIITLGLAMIVLVTAPIHVPMYVLGRTVSYYSKKEELD